MQRLNLLLKVGDLRKFRLISDVPKWYEAMILVPPPLPPPRYLNQQDVKGDQPFEQSLTTEQESHYRSQIEALLKSTETSIQTSPSSSSSLKKNKKKKLPHFMKPTNLPPPIVFPEDILRKRFYEYFPFELSRPQQLAESGPIQADYSTPLSERENVTGEDAIQHQLYLISQGMTVDEAFKQVAMEFESIRFKEEKKLTLAKESALKTFEKQIPTSFSEKERWAAMLKAKFPKNFAAWREEEEQLIALQEAGPQTST